MRVVGGPSNEKAKLFQSLAYKLKLQKYSLPKGSNQKQIQINSGNKKVFQIKKPTKQNFNNRLLKNL